VADGARERPSSDSPIAKIRRAKPAGLVDACWTKDGQKIVEKAAVHGGPVPRALPVAHVPALRRRRADHQRHHQVPAEADQRSDYKVTLSADDMARLKKIFPAGVCDWSKPGVEQQPLAGTWQIFNSEIEERI
jgi:hypothetical protein